MVPEITYSVSRGMTLVGQSVTTVATDTTERIDNRNVIDFIKEAHFYNQL